MTVGGPLVNSIAIPERFVGELESLTVNMNVADDPAPDEGESIDLRKHREGCGPMTADSISDAGGTTHEKEIYEFRKGETLLDR